MGSVRIEQSCRLIYEGKEYLVKLGSGQELASITLPDGQFMELPIDILQELAFLSIGRPRWAASTRSKYPRAGEKWTRHEDNNLARSFFDGIDIKRMARNHQRSRGAIVTRLEKLGHMTLSHIHASRPMDVKTSRTQ